jgi:hypothetical protein
MTRTQQFPTATQHPSRIEAHFIAEDESSQRDVFVDSKHRGEEDVVAFEPGRQQQHSVVHHHPQQAAATTSHIIPVQTKSVVNVVKPVAMKVLRPIPKRITEQYYHEAHQGGLTLQDTNQAAVLAHEWHRRWTQQEEVNHTMPGQDFYAPMQSTKDVLRPSHYAFDVDRQGAKNPSLGNSTVDSFGENQENPGDDGVSLEERVKRARQLMDAAERVLDDELDDMIVFHTEDRLSPAFSPGASSISSSLSSYMAPQVKRRFTGAALREEISNEDEPDDYDFPMAHRPVAPIAVRPMAVRPLAVRPHRPGLAPFTQEQAQSVQPVEAVFVGIPQDITALREQGSVSPMSCSPENSSLSNSLDMFYPPQDGGLMTVLPNEAELAVLIEDDEPTATLAPVSVLEKARDDVLCTLASTKGDVDSDVFKSAVDPLEKYWSTKNMDTRSPLISTNTIDGMWLTLSKPSFFGCLGENDDGDPMYTLGRMSFDMFSPTNLVCSLQGNFNPVEVVNEEDRKAMLEFVPKSLREEVENGATVLRTYHIVTAFTIEPSLASFPDAPNKDVSRPIKGIMTTYGYSLPDPTTPNRHSIWFTGGRIEPNDDIRDITGWKKLFALHPPKHSFGEKAKLLAVKLLMGATVPEEMAEDGSMEYTFSRPLGGHGMAYIDVIYLDDSMRVVRGHRGTTFVFSRVPER